MSENCNKTVRKGRQGWRLASCRKMVSKAKRFTLCFMRVWRRIFRHQVELIYLLRDLAKESKNISFAFFACVCVCPLARKDECSSGHPLVFPIATDVNWMIKWSLKGKATGSWIEIRLQIKSTLLGEAPFPEGQTRKCRLWFVGQKRRQPLSGRKKQKKPSTPFPSKGKGPTWPIRHAVGRELEHEKWII